MPVGRRFLFAEHRRAALTVLGVAAALLLVLVLDGIFAGAIDQVTHYIRTSPAQVFVSQDGVKTMHMSASALPPEAAARVRSVAGVDWVAPIGFASGSVAGPQGRQLSYLIGYDIGTGRGGPAELVTGRTPGTGEAVVDEQAAESLGVGVGDAVTVLGARLEVVGLSSGGSSITNTTVFISHWVCPYSGPRNRQRAHTASADQVRTAARHDSDGLPADTDRLVVGCRHEDDALTLSLKDRSFR